jgi:hypothetical protein
VIYKETVPVKKAINSEFYIQVLDGSLNCIWKSHNFNRKAAGSFSTKAPADSATTSEKFLENCCMMKKSTHLIYPILHQPTVFDSLK